MKLNARHEIGMQDASQSRAYYGELMSFDLTKVLEGQDSEAKIRVRDSFGGDFTHAVMLSEVDTCYCIRCHAEFSGWKKALDFCHDCKEEMDFLGKMDAENEDRREHVANGGSAYDF